MTLLAYAPPIVQVAVVTGRLTQGVTGYAVPLFSAELHFEDPAIADRWLPYPARFQLSDSGWFSFQLDPQTAAPEFDSVANVQLRVTFAVPGRAAFSEARTVSGADIRPTDTSVPVGGGTVEVKLLPGAPFDFSRSLDPMPIALEGYVLRDNDPETPAPGATVSVVTPAAAGTASTDSTGWFRLDALPVAELVTLRATDGARTAERTIRSDFSKPVNETIVSVSTA